MLRGIPTRLIVGLVLGLIVVVLILFSIVERFRHNFNASRSSLTLRQTLDNPSLIESRTLGNDLVVNKTQYDCTFHRCFNVYDCGYNDDTQITVYVYPIINFFNQNGVPATLPMSKEFLEILETISSSIYFTNDPKKACLFVPAIDLINYNSIQPETVAKALTTLAHWEGGRNHLLFNILSGTFDPRVLNIERGMALVAGAGYSAREYRRGYDVSVPLYNPLVKPLALADGWQQWTRRWLLVSSQFNIHDNYREMLKTIAARSQNRFLVLDSCAVFNYSKRCDGDQEYDYLNVLQEASFCLIMRGARLGQTALFDSMMAGCIPVVAIDGYVMPFEEILDWKRAVIFIYEQQLPNLLEIVSAVPRAKIDAMRAQVHFYWREYFSSMRRITLTTLRIINDRVFPYAGKKYEDWNESRPRAGVANPLFLPVIPPARQGFTAVVLTYNRLDSLFKVIKRVAKVPSLVKVLVVWNNQETSPPPAAAWPSIDKPLKVVRTEHNKLSNRFYPYDEIETEAILALDDDIVMLTSDEIEFGYQVWREFKDRLVGFPSRWHHLDNSTGKWRYDSEWTSEISLVLTGAAFYHKYYSYLYTNSMPGDIKLWVDDHINCEDLAMNFVIANFTGKSPIKVAPRKKFKCPECVNLLSADAAHMFERTDCINRFADIYGTMPLKTVDFRADPVLYKDKFPKSLKKFSDVGYI